MQELATKLSRSFDMKEESANAIGDNMRRHQVISITKNNNIIKSYKKFNLVNATIDRRSSKRAN